MYKSNLYADRDEVSHRIPCMTYSTHFNLQILMNVRLYLPNVMRMLTVLTIMETSAVLANLGSVEMGSHVNVSLRPTLSLGHVPNL